MDKKNVEAGFSKYPHFIKDTVRAINKVRPRRGMHIDYRDISSERSEATKKDKFAVRQVSRSTSIIAEMIGWRVSIHNGKTNIVRTVDSAMVGHKFGEFAETRQPVKHPVAKGAKQGAKGKK